MSQPEQAHINQLQRYRPACSQCGAPTTLARIDTARRMRNLAEGFWFTFGKCPSECEVRVDCPL